MLCSAFLSPQFPFGGITPSTTANHRETDRTIARAFIGALHSFETRILRFTVDHLCASPVLERGSSPSGYLPISVDQRVTLLSAKCAGEVEGAAKRQGVPAATKQQTRSF
jgi:hypothetical protein